MEDGGKGGLALIIAKARKKPDEDEGDEDYTDKLVSLVEEMDSAKTAKAKAMALKEFVHACMDEE